MENAEAATKWAHLDLLVHLRHAGGRLSRSEVNSVLSYWVGHYGSERHNVLSHLEQLGLIKRSIDGIALTPAALEGPVTAPIS